MWLTSEYILIVLWVGVLAFFARFAKIKRYELVDGVEEERVSFLIALLIIVPLVWMAAHRADIGDTYAYRRGFLKAMPDSLSGLSDYMKDITKDSGFYLFSALIKIFITKSHVVYFAIIASIQVFSVLLVYRKYSTSFLLSAFLFIVSADYFSWTYNGIRQFMAVAIIFAATTLIVKKKYIPLVLIILLAAQFHQSALLMIPIIFFVQGEAWGKKSLLLILGVVLALAFVGSFTSWLDDSLQGTQYHNVVSDYTNWKDNGTSPLRVAVFSVPAVIAFVFRNKIRQENNPLINICVNMSIITSALYIVSMVTSGVFLGRLPIYTSLFNYILLPWEINYLFDGKSKSIVTASSIILYLFFYVFQMHFTWALI